MLKNGEIGGLDMIICSALPDMPISWQLLLAKTERKHIKHHYLCNHIYNGYF